MVCVCVCVGVGAIMFFQVKLSHKYFHSNTGNAKAFVAIDQLAPPTQPHYTHTEYYQEYCMYIIIMEKFLNSGDTPLTPSQKRMQNCGLVSLIRTSYCMFPSNPFK